MRGCRTWAGTARRASWPPSSGCRHCRSSRLTRGYSMIAGYHVIFGAYGFWLPNDPRGSWSDFVASWELFRHGPATKTDSRQSVAHEAHDRLARLQAKEALKYPPVQFTGRQAFEVAMGFRRAIAKS